MRWLLIILTLLPTMLWGQTSPALNTLTGPYRGPTSWVTPKTLKDSIDVLEARLLAAISDSTGLAFDSVYALSAALTDMRNRYLADSARVADSLRVHATRTDSLYTKIRLDSLCLVNLNFSRATYSNNIWTIPNDANKAAPAYMYGGLGWGANGSDSSGISRDSLTGRVVMNMDGSAGDSIVYNFATVLDSLQLWKIAFWLKPLSAAATNRTILITKYDTSSTNNYGTWVMQVKDSIYIKFRTPNNTLVEGKKAGVFTVGTWQWVEVSKTSSGVQVQVNMDSVYSLGTSLKQRQINKIVFGGHVGTSPLIGAYANILFFTRHPTSAERLTLYNNSLRGIQPPGPSMAEVVQEAQKAAGDSARADTVGLTAGSNITITGTAPHRYTIASTASGGGGLPYDTTQYRRILGWPSDSALYGSFSGWRMLDNRTARADSATGDSLWSSIDQLKTTGGRILVLGADTVHVYRLTAYDSLPTAGGITSTVSVYGTPQTVIQCKDASAAPFSFTVNRPAGTGTAFLEFRNLRIKTTAAAALISVSRGRLLFDDCDMDGGMLTIPMADGNAGDSLIVFNNCRLNDAIIYASLRMGLLNIDNCEGNISTGNPNSSATLHAAKYGWHFNNSRMLGIGSIESSNGNAPVFISGGSLRQTVTNKSMFSYCDIQASGASFYFHPSATTYAYIGTNNTYNSLSSYSGCFFWGGGVSAVRLQVTGCTFRGSTTAINLGYGGVVNSCTVQGATTAVVCGAGYTTKIHGLAQNGCSTFISGTPTTVADTLTY